MENKTPYIVNVKISNLITKERKWNYGRKRSRSKEKASSKARNNIVASVIFRTFVRCYDCIRMGTYKIIL